MSGSGAEVGVAYVTLAVSGQGIVSGIQKEMAGVATAAAAQGDKAGKALGKGLLIGVGVVAGGAALAGKALYGIGSTFDDVADTIRVGAGATGKALDDLVGSAKNIGTKVPADFADVGVAVADLNTRLGVTGKPLETLGAQFLELSRLTGTDLQTNIADITRTFGAWNITAEAQPVTMDKIFRASQATGIGIGELNQAMVKFGPALQQMGFGFDESLAVISNFEKAGVNMQPALAAMQRGLANLSKAGEDPPKALARITDEIKNAGSSAEANRIAMEVFGVKAGPELANAIRTGALETSDLLALISGGSETIMAAASDTNDFAEAWQVFKNKALVAIEPVATRVFEAFSTGFQWFTDKGLPAIKSVGEAIWEKLQPGLATMGEFMRDTVVPAVKDLATWFKDKLYPVLESAGSFISGTVVPALGDMAGWLAKNKEWILPLVAAFGAAVVALKAWQMGVVVVSAVTKAWGTVQAAFNAIMAANPIMIVVIALAALAAGIAYAWTHSETFREVIYKVWEALKVAWQAIVDFAGAIKDAVVGAFSAVIDFFSGLWDWLKGFFAEWGPVIIAVIAPFIGIPLLIYQNFDKIVGFLKDVFGRVGTAISGFITNAVAWFAELPGKIYGALAAMADWLTRPYREAWSAVSGFFSGTLWPGIRDFFAALPQNIYNALVGFVDWLTRPYREAWSAISGYFVDTLWPGIKDFFSGLPEKIYGALSALAEWVSRPFRDAWEAIGSALSYLWQGSGGTGGIKGFFTNLPKNIIDAIGDLGGKLKDFFLGLWDKIKEGVTGLLDKIASPFKSLWGLITGNGGGNSGTPSGSGPRGTGGPAGVGGSLGIGSPWEQDAVDTFSQKLYKTFTTIMEGSGSRYLITAFAKSFAGKVPYVWGGETPKGWDCSGFVGYVLSHFGIKHPRVAKALQAWFPRVATPLPGDLIFYGDPAYHVAMALGNGLQVEARGRKWGTGVWPVRSYSSIGRIPAYLHGGDVPGTGPVPAILHGGEHVLTAGDTDLMRGLVAGLSKRGGGGNTFNFYGYRPDEASRMADDFVERVGFLGVQLG